MSRDIKLENTLLVLQPDKKPLLKLCDFGYSKHDTLDSVAKSKVGTPGYTAPGASSKRGRRRAGFANCLVGGTPAEWDQQRANVRGCEGSMATSIQLPACPDLPACPALLQR